MPDINLPIGADNASPAAFGPAEDINKKAEQRFFDDSYAVHDGQQKLPARKADAAPKTEQPASPAPVSPWNEESDRIYRQIAEKVRNAGSLHDKNQGYSAESEIMEAVALFDKLPIEQTKAYLESQRKDGKISATFLRERELDQVISLQQDAQYKAFQLALRNHHPAEAKQLFNELVRSSEWFRKSEYFQEIGEGLSKWLRPTDKVASDPLLPVVTIDGQRYESQVGNSETFRNVFMRNWSRLNTNDDGFVSEEEIDRAISNPIYKGVDAQLVRTLKNVREKLQKLGNDEGGTEDDGVSWKDMTKFDMLQKNRTVLERETAQLEYAKENFQKLFPGKDSVDRKDILAALRNPALSNEEGLVLDRLLGRWDKVSDMGRVWPSSIGAVAGRLRGRLDLIAEIDSTMMDSWRRTQDTNYNLYSNQKFPLESIKPDAVNQGYIGDCYFLAPIASIAAIDPALLREMIWQNKDGTYTVTFPGAYDEPITVAPPTQTEMSLFARGSERGVWVPILEKAYGEYCSRHFWRRGLEVITGTTNPTESAGGGGLLSSGLEILTGLDVVNVDLMDGNRGELIENVHARLVKAMKESVPVTAGSKEETLSITARVSSGKEERLSLPGNHAFGITKYDPQTRMVTVFNPWGKDSSAGPPEIMMPLLDFIETFEDVSFTER